MSLSVGKSIGRVSIRALPDTKNFRRDLLRQLKRIEETTRVGITVDRARVSRTKVRADIERQLEGLDTGVEANVKVIIDKAKLSKKKLRASIQEQFDQFGDIRVGIAAHIRNSDEFKREVDKLVREASLKDAKINVNAATSAATAQMRWLTRDRFVDIIPRVSKAAAAKAAATIAAISGGRLAFDWVKSLLENIGNLDKALPTISLATTGLTTLGAVLLGAVSGLVGIGQGFVAMAPLLLTVPGLIINAAGSLTVLAVALQDASEQLAPLKDDMSELRDIISTGFWDQAREPIIDLVEGLMPQLRTSFERLADGVGGFVGSLADSFAEKLGGGRLDAIFANIDKGWDILATGTDGFAGAIVSLSEIAAKYTPRLAEWFVRQVDTFDAWLTAISTDGRLDQWIEDGIDAVYALWDATTGIAGQFKALWRAAEAAGSGGLRGFADTMQRWSDVMNGERFQKGMTALFAGSNTALEALGDGLARFGTLIADNSAGFEHFIATAGEAFGGLLGDMADALNQPEVARGFRDFIDGIKEGFEGFGDYLPEIGRDFGSLLSTAGALAEQLGPVLGAALEAVGDLLTPIADTLREDVIPVLGPALKDAIETIGPKLEDFGEALGPVLTMLSDMAVRVLPSVVSALEAAIELARPILDGAGRATPEDRDPEMQGWEQFLAGFGELATFLLNVPNIFTSLEMLGEALSNPAAALERLQGVLDGEWGVMWQELATAMTDFGGSLSETFGTIGTEIGLFGERWHNFWTGNGWVTNDEMTKIEDKVRGGMGGGMSAMSGFQSQGQPMWSGFMGNLSSTASTAWQNIVTSVSTGVTNAVGFIASLPGRIGGVFAGVGSWLWQSGASLIQGFINGIGSMIGAVQTAVGNAVQAARDFFPFSPAKRGPFSGRGWTGYSGQALMRDFADGILSNAGLAADALNSALDMQPEAPSFDGVTAAAAAAVGAGASQAPAVTRTTNVTVNNPTPEPASTSITRTLDKVAYLGLDDEEDGL
jgi:hypothetical protein